MSTITISRKYSTKVEPTKNVIACAAMFGIGVDETIDIELYRGLKINIESHKIIYFTGDSGAGKSCALRDIRDKLDDDKYYVITQPTIKDMPNKPLVDQFGGWDLNNQIGPVLNYVGISEAFIYLRKPKELSDGQRYRFILSAMIYKAVENSDGRQPVIMIDEYLAFLDRQTAKNVAYQTRRVATKYGLCFVVATTHNDIADDLQANTSITLRLNLPPDRMELTKVGDGWKN